MAAVCGIIIKKDSGDLKTLIIKRSYKFSEGGAWEPPKGGVEPGEDPRDAVIREVKEETGLDVEPVKMIKKEGYLSRTGTRSDFYVYICKLKNKNQKVKISFEHTDYKWVDLHTAREMIWGGYENIKHDVELGFKTVEKRPSFMESIDMSDITKAIKFLTEELFKEEENKASKHFEDPATPAYCEKRINKIFGDTERMNPNKKGSMKPIKENVINEKDSKWIQKAHIKKGALHKELGVPEDKKIPASKLTVKADDSPKLKRRKLLAKTLKKLHHEGRLMNVLEGMSVEDKNRLLKLIFEGRKIPSWIPLKKIDINPESIADHRPSPEDMLIAKDTSMRARKLNASMPDLVGNMLKTLTPREKEVLRMRHGGSMTAPMRGEQNLSTIAKHKALLKSAKALHEVKELSDEKYNKIRKIIMENAKKILVEAPRIPKDEFLSNLFSKAREHYQNNPNDPEWLALDKKLNRRYDRAVKYDKIRKAQIAAKKAQMAVKIKPTPTIESLKHNLYKLYRIREAFDKAKEGDNKKILAIMESRVMQKLSEVITLGKNEMIARKGKIAADRLVNKEVAALPKGRSREEILSNARGKSEFLDKETMKYRQKNKDKLAQIIAARKALNN